MSSMLLVLISLLAISGCTKSIVARSTLRDQILKPREGFEGKLTNSRCAKYDGYNCKDLQIVTYDIRDSGIRENLNKLDFICMVGTKRYKVCKDKAGFCRRTFKPKKWYRRKRKLKSEDFISIDKYDFLIQAKTRCFNKYIYSGDYVR